MNTKVRSVMLLVVTILSLASCNGQAESCCGGDKSKSSCTKKCSTNSNSKKMTKQTEICSKCGNVSCDASCSSNPKEATTLDGKKLKTLIPSCNLSETAIIDRKDELGQRGIFLKVQTIKELSDGYDFIFNESKKTSQEILDYINFEKNCCSNFSFAIEFEPNLGAVHLKIYGSKAIKKQMKNAIDVLQIGKR